MIAQGRVAPATRPCPAQKYEQYVSNDHPIINGPLFSSLGCKFLEITKTPKLFR